MRISVLLVLLSFGMKAFGQCRQQDSLQLVALYNATNGSRWLLKTNWLTARPLDTWYGIEVNAQGCVTKIRLPGDSLRGTIPPLNLTELTELYLNNNLLN
jgi:hypothetical protein